MACGCGGAKKARLQEQAQTSAERRREQRERRIKLAAARNTADASYFHTKASSEQEA